ncbi:Hypothetical predicted protein [Mytilus galloprovincialis]|uniref:Uncharacterized protein n=1 Tax=Mytilus galloprovincialis TaxID=29158 RepID=A0A8B6H110_MYTGA|nr:Hypothetical predicted protein [Mytilus galloprovincialis]
MDSLYLVVLFSVLTEIHGDARRESLTDECLLDQCKASTEIRSCAKDLCRKSLASCIEIWHKERAEKRGKNGGVELTKDGRNNNQNQNKDKTKTSMDMIIVVSALVSISISASVTITVLCYQRHRSKHSLTRPVGQEEIITESVDESDYTSINYNEMTDMSLPETNENSNENNTTPREPQAITDMIQQTGDTLTEYESLSNNRTSVEHIYELESTQNNQYQLLTTQRNLFFFHPRNSLWNMKGLYVVVLFSVLTEIHGNARRESSTDECLLKQCKASTEIRSCAKGLCRKSLASCIEILHKERAEKRGKNDGVELTKDGRNNNQNRNKDKKKKIFKLGTIVGISVGITGTLILFLIILVIIVICRRRSKKKKRKHQKRLQSLDKRLEMANLESSPSSTNKGLYNIRNTDKSVNTYEAQTRCSVAEGDDNVYYEIDEDKIESLTDIEGVHQKQIKEVRDKGSFYSDQTGYESQLGSKKNREQLPSLQSVDLRFEMANLEKIPSSSNKEGHTIRSANTDEAQDEYFVLDPSVTKYDKDLHNQVLPEVKVLSVAQGDGKNDNEITEDKIKSSTDIEVEHHKQMEDVRDI